MQSKRPAFLSLPRWRTQVARLQRAGKVRPGILLWALGVPIPLVLLFLLIRGCA